MMNKWLFYVYGTIFCFLISSCANNKPDTAQASPKVDVQIVVANSRDFTADIASFGSVVYTQKNDVTMVVNGIIEQLLVKEGDQVNAGQKIAILENVQLRIQKRQAESALKSAEASTKLYESQYLDYRRQIESLFISIEQKEIQLAQKEKDINALFSNIEDQQKLLTIGGVTEESMKAARQSLESMYSEREILQKELAISNIGLRDIDIINSNNEVPSDPQEKRKLLIDLNSKTKKAELNVALAQEETARAELTSVDSLINELTVIAPITGIVGAVYKERGERIEDKDKLLTIFSADDAWVIFPVNENNLHRLRKDMPVTITVQSLQQEPIAGRIDIISPTVDPQSGNITVKAIIKKAGNRLKPGMFANVLVITDTPEKKILIPLSCLSQRTDASGIVMTVRNGVVFKRKVTLGVEYKGEIEISDGIKDGEFVVLEPTPLLRDGDEVITHEN